MACQQKRNVEVKFEGPCGRFTISRSKNYNDLVKYIFKRFNFYSFNILNEYLSY